jgi:hypothetical protein
MYGSLWMYGSVAWRFPLRGMTRIKNQKEKFWKILEIQSI